MNKLYPSRINWHNEPSTATPIDEINLNKMDKFCDDIDDRVIEIDTRVQGLEDIEPTVLGYATRAENAASDSEAYAIGKRGNTDVVVGDPAYHNNALFYAAKASTFASNAHTSETNASNSESAAASSASNSEAYAVGKRNGEDVPSTDPTYHNNAKYYLEQALSSATDAGMSASGALLSAHTAEAYAIGKVSGVDVTSSNVAYHNNALYYAAKASNSAASAADSEAFAVGQRGGVDVPSTDPTYHNNSKYYAEQAGISEGNASTSESNAAISAASASSFASTADNRAADSEAWAVGKRRGQDVSQSDETYHNNAEYWAKQAAQAAGGGVTSFNGRSQAVEPMEGDYTAAMVGLGNVDNTSDLNKPLSYAMSSALALKTPKSDIAPTEVSPSTHAYKQGDIFYYNGVLYKAKAAIAVDDVLTVGTNIETTTISATSGGHVIVDESGNLLTQRSKLKFMGDVTVTDDAVNDVTIVDVEGGGTIIVQKPTVVVGTYTYNGSPQGPTITWATGMADNCVISNATKTDAGTYTLTIALKNATKMVWDDMSVSDLTYNYTIGKATVTLPAVTDTAKTYNGSEQSPTIASYDSTKLTVSGDSATNAGDYTVVFALVDSDNYTMSGTNNVAWSIAKATSVITVSSASVTLDGDHLTATVTVGNNLGRTLSVSTSDSTVATASISGSTVTISNVNQKSGNATITVSASESANYNASSVTVSVTASFFQIVTFHDGTDAQIKAMLDAYYADSITWSEMGWAVGDTRTIHLNSRSAPNPNSGTTLGAEDITVVIVGHDHHDLATPINGHTKACISVQFREALGSTSYNGKDGTIYVNGDSSYDMSFTKWSNLYMRTYLNGTLLGAIPTGDFKSAIKQSKHYRHTNYNDANAEQVTDTLFLPSYAEIFGTASWTFYTPTSPTEGTQLPYYETASNRIKYANNNGESSGNAIYWWNGSASSYYDSSIGYFWCSVTTGGSAYNHYGTVAFGVAPAFAM